MDDLFPVYQKNKKITTQDIYDSFGATLHVLSDTYEGKLKDEATAAKNHIYEKKAAENGTVQITAEVTSVWRKMDMFSIIMIQ